MTDDRRARMGLLAAGDGGDPALAALVRERGAPEVWDHLRSGHSATALAGRAGAVDLEALLRETEGAGARFLVPGDEEWPAAVGDLAWSEPVGTFGGEPLGLWVIGPADLGALTGAVAIVGSRASTAYGEHIAADWAVGVAERGHPVISGGAYGIDACAHRGALAAGGITVAVMAGGLAQLYPPGNAALLKRVQTVGAVVSEHPPSRPPSRGRFLARNRLIAALARATVIVEGAVRSGAQNTVSWALSMQRVVLAAPGPVTSAMSVTPHRLIRDGEAVLVSSAEDIVAALGEVDAARPTYARDQPRAFDALTDQQKAVYEAMPARRAVCVDELCAITGEAPLAVLVALGQLASLGVVAQAEEGRWKVVPRARSTGGQDGE